MAKIVDLNWITGTWKGNAFGGTVYEQWSALQEDSMTGYFKLIKEGKADFYEFLIIEQEGEQVMYNFIHYSRGLIAWDKEPLSFKLTSLTGEEALFESIKENTNPRSLHYKRTGDNLNVRVTRDNGETFDVPFTKE